MYGIDGGVKERRTEFGQTYHLAELVCAKVEEALEGQVLLLDLADHFLGEALELSQWRHAQPAAVLDHLAQVERLVC